MEKVVPFRTGYGSGLCAVWYDGSFLFVLFTPSSGADGHVSGSVDYDVFGKPVTETGVFAGSAGGSGGISALVFAYAGKPYDPVTGLSDYGFRDYAPSLARFTTVDPIRDGSNWYAYCNSDPVNYVDMWGLKPVEGSSPGVFEPVYFDTMDEAAIDFAAKYNQRSIQHNEEWGATIYKVNGKYTYTKPRTDHKPCQVNFSLPPGGEIEAVGALHTHGKYIDDEGTDFSEYDYMLADQKGLPTYIVNPRGELRKYDPNTSTEHKSKTIATNLPSDPNDPGSPKGCQTNTH